MASTFNIDEVFELAEQIEKQTLLEVKPALPKELLI